MRHAGESQLHSARLTREVGQRKDDRHEREARKAQEGTPPAAPALVPEHEKHRVVREDHERHRHRGVEVTALEASGADADPECQEDDGAENAPRREPVEGVERRHAHAEHSPLVALQPPFLPDVERSHSGSERQACERGEHQRDVNCEHGSGALALIEGRPAPCPGEREQRGRDRHHGEAEQPVARRAAPDQIGADDQPDEEVGGAGPSSPWKSLCARPPARRGARSGQATRAGRPRLRAGRRGRVREAAGIGDRRFAVGEQHRDDEELSHCL